MSVEIIRDQIFKFLSSEQPEVMAIKGEWGVGKTYSWKKFLSEARNEKKVNLEHYSYVSLFGINSLDSFKYTIFENVVTRDLIGTEASIATFKDNATSLMESFGRRSEKLFKDAPIENVVKRELIGTKASIATFKDNTTSLIKSFGRRSAKFFKDAPIGKSFSPAIEAIYFLSLNKTLICIDDLERRGKELDIRDILGLVSLLKEQKGCKVVLLLNDSEVGLEDYKKYREKVIDIELAFSLNPEESAAIAFSSDAIYYNRVKELTTSLNIRNIRILKKIERQIDLALPLVKDFEPEILDQVIHTLVLYSWSYFTSNSDNGIPTLDVITRKAYSLLGIGNDKITDQQKKWQPTLQAYNYQPPDDLDLVLAEAVKAGFFVKGEVIEKASLKNQQVIASNSKNSFFDAWGLYHNTFDDDGDVVVDEIYKSFKANCKYITPADLNATVTLFKKLGKEQKALEIIDIYIKSRKDEVKLFDMAENNTFGDIQDPDVIKKFNAIYNQSIPQETAKQVLDRITGSNGWNSSDEKVLASTTVDEYYKLFKNEKRENLSSFVKTCLNFGQSSDSNEQQKEITARATEALQKIASESKINKMRVKKFGVSIENS